MTHLFNATSSEAIALVLLALMAACVEVGYRVGRSRSTNTPEASRTHIHGIQSAILGLLALLLAFAFSLALQRFDNRSEAVVDEANAIGTALLRADLLPQPLRQEARIAIGKYIDARVEESTLPLPEQDALAKVNKLASDAQAAIWGIAVRATQLDAHALPPHLFAEAVNQLIDSYGRRNAGLSRHVPGLVLALLLVTLLLSSAIMGFTAGVANHRPSLATHVLVGLMVVSVFIVLDLDRPRRGIIQVSNASLLELQSAFKTSMHNKP